MSKSVNKVILIGNLGKDPESKVTPGGKTVTEFSIATSFGSGDKEETEWHNIVTWEKTAENAAKYLHKGSKVYVEGRLRTRQWEKDGVTHYKTEVVAFEVGFLDNKPAGAAQSVKAPAEDPFA